MTCNHPAIKLVYESTDMVVYRCIKHPDWPNSNFCGELIIPYCMGGQLDDGNYRKYKNLNNILELYEKENFSPMRAIL